jgi:hypothetical protein
VQSDQTPLKLGRLVKNKDPLMLIILTGYGRKFGASKLYLATKLCCGEFSTRPSLSEANLSNGRFTAP